MFCCSAPADVTGSQISEEIDKKIKVDAKNAPIVILLLGTGDSGKSTVLKQMKITHGTGFDKPEMELFAKRIHSNTSLLLRNLVKSSQNTTAEEMEHVSNDIFWGEIR